MHPRLGSSSAVKLAQSYLNALHSNDLHRILTHFAADADIISPTYGRMKAAPFYEKLCSDTKSVTISVRQIDHGAADPHTVYAYFNYTWVLSDGTTKELEIFDIFHIEHDKIQSLRIFADGRK